MAAIPAVDTHTFSSRAELLAHYRAVRLCGASALTHKIISTPTETEKERKAARNEKMSAREIAAEIGIAPYQEERAVTANRIVTAVRKEFGVTWAQLLGPMRGGKALQARALAVYLLRELTGDSFATIGRRFRNR